jgi:hypothetical protein
MVEKKDPWTHQGKDDESLARLLQDITTPTVKPDSGLGAEPTKVDAPRPTLNSMRPAATAGGAASSGTWARSTVPSAPPPSSGEAQTRPAVGAGADTANKQPSLQYVDDPTIREIFADGLNTVHFDGHTLRIEFGVTRAKRSDAPGTQVLERLPACRLVLSPQALTELKALMQKVPSAAPQQPASGAGKEQK